VRRRYVPRHAPNIAVVTRSTQGSPCGARWPMCAAVRPSLAVIASSTVGSLEIEANDGNGRVRGAARYRGLKSDVVSPLGDCT
jgi:hypothetical protein